MKAKEKIEARSLLRMVIVLGTIATAVVGTACSKSDDGGSDEGIGVSNIQPVANTAEAANPVDATPSPDGTAVYFIAYSTKANEDEVPGTYRVPAIYKAAATGGAVQKLFEGAPLAAPFGISISDDGQTLFIADSSAETGENEDGGKVFTMNVGGGSPSPLAGTEGIHPSGIEVMKDKVYITGRKDGQPGLFKTGLGGGAVTPVLLGAPFSDPSGVTVSRSGEVFVVDSGNIRSEVAKSSVIKVGLDGKAEVIIEGLSVGHPAGIALVNDESAVLVSALDEEKATDVVFRVNLGSREVKPFTDKIGGFYESAGLHRARNADVFAWADSHANGTGTVYLLSK